MTGKDIDTGRSRPGDRQRGETHDLRVCSDCGTRRPLDEMIWYPPNPLCISYVCADGCPRLDNAPAARA
jgi:hypothetical protein